MLSIIPKPRLAFLVASSLVASALVLAVMMLAMPTGLPPAHLLGGTHYGPAEDAAVAAAEG